MALWIGKGALRALGEWHESRPVIVIKLERRKQNKLIRNDEFPLDNMLSHGAH